MNYHCRCTGKQTAIYHLSA